MYHAADHTMSNVMGAVGLWEEEFARLKGIRKAEGVSNRDWGEMKKRATNDPKRSFLKALAHILEGRI